MKRTVITNVRVFDGHRVLDGISTITIFGAQIFDISPYDPQQTFPADTETVDGTSCTLLPGLIDSHVHVDKPQQLDKLASAGVTTALDMACFPASLMGDIRNASLATGPDGSPRPAILSAGLIATAPGSTHSKMLGGQYEECLLTSPEQAKPFVTKRVAEGSDYIKLVADIPGPSQETLDALVAAAKTAGKKTVVHAAAYEPFHMAVQSGADLVTHVPMGRSVDAAWAETLAEEDRTCCPTLIMMEGMCNMLNAGPPPGIGPPPAPQTPTDSEPRPKPSFAHSNESVRTLLKAGVRMLAGTDAHEAPFAPVPHGTSMHRELQLMNKAGMDPMEVLISATSAPAKYWGLQGKGVVELNATADLILVEGQPSTDITDIGNVKGVWIGGKKVLKVTPSR
ncbi:hypothetical protein VMCG_05982 [Cytospora schulzeri]|uniref:Amidohydrolase-related domain-containing protein n=1 Tax=Cytospora schulzeri TaxID=448051 RepID=A0A423WD60_9PEZI|nr:hypothetical protein VMCG_05982 [Valsa malicola]